MQIYLAPLEGITGHLYRSAVHRCFGGFDKYFIPFIRPNQKGHFSTREKKDVNPENNAGMVAIPQILTNNGEDFLRSAKKLAEYGYNEVNLNLGCPSKTVVTKGRGAGFLAYPDRLDRFLEEIFSKCPMEISIKTRLGMEGPEEFWPLLDIFSRYPVKELIIHPRVQADFYKNEPDLDAFGRTFERAACPVCYNGDLKKVSDVERLCGQFPDLSCIMAGRGVLADPAFGRRLRGGKEASKEELRRFHDILYHSYCEEMSGDRTILYKMKEMWFYLSPAFTNYKKYGEKIKKCEKCVNYEEIVNALFRDEELVWEE